MPRIVPVTPELMGKLYDEPVAPTVRALAVVDGDEVLGISGVYPDSGRLVLFSRMSEAVMADRKRYARWILRCVRTLMGWAAELRMPMHAAADPDVEGSERLLEHLGFHRLHKEVYEWTS